MVEREKQYLGLDPGRESIFDERNEPVTVIYDNLMSFMFEYFDAGSPTQPPRWVKEWNPRETREMPTAISMTMISRDGKGGLLNRHMVVPILAKAYDARLSSSTPSTRAQGGTATMTRVRRDERGVILIALLWILTAIAVIALSFSRESFVEVAAARNARDLADSYFIARAGISATVYKLIERRYVPRVRQLQLDTAARADRSRENFRAVRRRRVRCGYPGRIG